jgi:hypothetical protein
MFFQKPIRVHIQPPFQSDNVIGVQKKIEISAASIKTGNPRITVKIKAVFGFKPPAGQSVKIVDIYMFHASPNEHQPIIFNL